MAAAAVSELGKLASTSELESVVLKWVALSPGPLFIFLF